MTADWSSEASDGALSGLRVLDLSRVLAGPYATQILGDHGADVLKVEAPGGDETRRWGPPFIGDTSAYFMGINRNKRGVVLDLTTSDGQGVLAGLMAGADVMIENFKKGTLEKWGFGRERLEAEFPHLVHCRITGYGDDGPCGGLPGYDAALQAMSGMMSINGETGSRALRVGIPVCDLVTGLNAVIGILMAVRERQTSGKGQLVDVSLLDAGLSMLHPHSANFLATGKVPGRTGNAHPNITPYDTYETATGPVFLAVGSDRQFTRLCEMIGAADVAADPRFASNADRCAHRADLKLLLEQALASHEVEKLAADLNAAGVPAAPVLDLSQALNHPQTQARGMVWEQDGYKAVGSPIHLSRTPAALRRGPPKLDE